MRSHCGLYVDVGYLLSAAATRVVGSSLRGSVTVDHAALIEGLIHQVESDSGLPILRLNWYDASAGMHGAPNPEQNRVAMLPRVKLRLGRRSMSGEQKGVDLRLGLDLVTHGRGRAVDSAYLLSGDDDLTEAVEEAQDHGVQVFVLAVPTVDGAPHGVAANLQRAADGLLMIDPETIDAAISPRQHSALPSAARPTPADLAHHTRPVQPVPTSTFAFTSVSGAGPGSAVIDDEPDEHTRELIREVCHGVISAWERTADADERAAVQRDRPIIPPELDRALLTDLSTRTGAYYIDERKRYWLREYFWEVLG